MKSEKHQEFVTLVRQRFGYCSPFRLGIAVGESGADIPGPYKIGSRGERLYLEGVECGKQKTHTALPASATS